MKNHFATRAALSAILLAAAASTPAAQDAATRSQSARTERAQRDANVPDETGVSSPSAAAANPAATSTATAHAPAQSARPLPPPYGPVLTPRQPIDGASNSTGVRKPPAEVRDETDSRETARPAPGEAAPQPATQLATPPATPPATQSSQQPSKQSERQTRGRPVRRHPAWQLPGSLAPRPATPPIAPPATAGSPVPVPAPSPAPQPVVPSSTIAGPCHGGVCTDASGTTYNGAGAGVSSGGRLCVRGAATVQCF